MGIQGRGPLLEPLYFVTTRAGSIIRSGSAAGTRLQWVYLYIYTCFLGGHVMLAMGVSARLGRGGLEGLVYKVIPL